LRAKWKIQTIAEAGKPPAPAGDQQGRFPQSVLGISLLLPYAALNPRRKLEWENNYRDPPSPLRVDCASSCLTRSRCQDCQSSPTSPHTPDGRLGLHRTRASPYVVRTGSPLPHHRTLPTGGWVCTPLEARPTSSGLAVLVPLPERALLPLPKTTDRSADPKGMPAGFC
jgi:hypothetical protein